MSDANLKQQVRALQNAPDYWHNPDKQAQARGMIAKIRSDDSRPAVYWVPTSAGFIPE